MYVIYDNESNIKITYQIDIYIADKLYQIRKGDKPQDNLKNISGKVLIVIAANSGIEQSIVNIAKTEGAIVHRFSRENGVDISEILMLPFVMFSKKWKVRLYNKFFWVVKHKTFKRKD